jgi:bifunctional UDP-N-acetylglucosamine pyrophosphorylase/glucosamine-1-phosphate N-acetyltransferase
MLHPLNVIIMAAGVGKRMRSHLPKVLHPLAGKPLLAHVLATVREITPARIVIVVGEPHEAIRRALADPPDVTWVRQTPPRGTGDAVACALPACDPDAQVLILNGDVPLIARETLHAVARPAAPRSLCLLTANTDDPREYGRLLRDDHGRITGIVEAKDATADQRRIREWYTGTLSAHHKDIARWLPRLDNANAQGEYYLTDIVRLAHAEGTPIVATQPGDPLEVEGINTPADLAALERRLQRRIAQRLLDEGVTLLDPARIDVRGTLLCASNVRIDVNCVFEGRVELGEGVLIGPNCVLRDCRIGAGSEVHAFSHIDGADVARRVRIGPYARLRPGTVLADDVHVGNFVEIKATRIGSASKANHLTYLGDAEVGANTNIGAGTITCNYDGANKHRTEIGSDVHVGSDVQLVAPVRVADGATIAAGTTVWKDAPAGTLTLNEKIQTTRPAWRRPRKT